MEDELFKNKEIGKRMITILFLFLASLSLMRLFLLNDVIKDNQN
jgi:hypothetical protein